MKWISGLVWTGLDYVVETVGKDGAIGTLPVERLAELQLRTGRVQSTGIHTDFSTWHLVGPQEYLEAMGFSNQTKNAQEVYQFEINGKIFQVPSSVLLAEFFYPFRKIGEHLFRPQGLENIISSSSLGRSVDYFCAPSTLFGRFHNELAGRKDVLSWMYCFPSARKMWDSVLIKARKGIFSVHLPEATVTPEIQAVPHNGKWFVTVFSIFKIQTFEKPFDFAKDFKQTIQLRERYLSRPRRSFEKMPL